MTQSISLKQSSKSRPLRIYSFELQAEKQESPRKRSSHKAMEKLVHADVASFHRHSRSSAWVSLSRVASTEIS